jgi:hypothetical protein
MIPKNPSGFLPSVFPGSGSARRAVAGTVALVDRGWLEAGPVIAHRTASVFAASAVPGRRLSWQGFVAGRDQADAHVEAGQACGVEVVAECGEAGGGVRPGGWIST